jgi:hypothetical protein
MKKHKATKGKKKFVGQNLDSATCFQQAIALHQVGALEQAELLYRQILAQEPSHADALHLLGLIRHRQADTEGALAFFDQAVSITPDKAPLYYDRAVALRVLNREEEALASYDRAISINYNYPKAHFNRANLLGHLGRLEDALAGYDRVLTMQSDLAEAYINRGNVLVSLKRYEEALSNFDSGIKIHPGIIENHICKGSLLLFLNRPNDALTCYQAVLSIHPGHNDANNGIGKALENQGCHTDALHWYGLAKINNPECVNTRFNESYCQLKLGDLENGLANLEWCTQTANPLIVDSFSQPLWLGKETLMGKTILLHAEHGLGDTIQFARYAPLVAKLGARVVLKVEPDLKITLSELPGVEQVFGSGENLPDYAYHCPLLSLPLAFNTRLDSIPADIPYIFSQTDKVQVWRGRLGEKTMPRIGLRWSGNPEHSNDHNRSIPLAKMVGLISSEMLFFSLQNEVRKDDLPVLEKNQHLHFFGDQLHDFTDTAALVELMDLVISVDTSVAHLAAAMGKPVWLLLPFDPDWRWLLEREDSPWYPSMRLFRQPEIGNWDAVLDRVKLALIQHHGPLIERP